MRYLSIMILVLGLAGTQVLASDNKDGSNKKAASSAEADDAIKICLKCGEIKGDAKCCKAEGRTKCGGCGLFKGAVGCCKIPNTICKSCGEIKGTAKCCDAENRTKCGGCGMFKGAVGCCKIKADDGDKKENAEGSGR